MFSLQAGNNGVNEQGAAQEERTMLNEPMHGGQQAGQQRCEYGAIWFGPVVFLSILGLLLGCVLAKGL